MQEEEEGQPLPALLLFLELSLAIRPSSTLRAAWLKMAG